MSDDQTTDKDDGAVLSKRKKHLDSMKSGQSKHTKKPKVSWTQSNEDVTVSFRLEGMRNDQLKNLDVQFSDTDVSVSLSDGRNWIWNLNKEIFREKSKVKIKKGTVTLHMKKKHPLNWEDLEIPEAGNVMEDEHEKPAENIVDSEQMPESDHREEVEVKGDENEGLCLTTSTLDEEVKVPEDECSNEETEVFEKEEEPVVELQHIKHDYIEKENTFVVHIYVKGVSKDNLMVVFEPKTFRVKFQTSNEQFLKLHKDATFDTKFRWQVILREEVISERCSCKVTSSFIELSLYKKEALRWGDLEALKCRETPVAKSETWIPLGNVKTSSETETVDRQVMFDEMKQSIERQNLSEKAADSGPNPSPSTEIAQPKPMCKVQPLSKQPEVKEQVVTPGYTGLDNLGNTCFMNGVLQCLANTREFRDFFLNGEFQKDLNIENVLGSGGKLAVCFAVLMRVLWSGKYVSYPPSKLKSLVAQKASQFTGFAQHDSQEFLAFLLDGLHEVSVGLFLSPVLCSGMLFWNVRKEYFRTQYTVPEDLNRIKKKPYTETVEDRGRPDEVVANEAWEVHKKRNDSFVVDLFQGQYKSKLVCPVCGKVSITFDPFLYLSLPLPKRQRLLPVTFMWKDPYKKPIRYMLRLSKEATVEQLKDALQKKTGVNPENIRVLEAYRGRIHKIFKRGSSLSNVQANDCIIGCEVYSKEMAGEPVYEVAVVQRTLMPNQFPSRCHNCKKLCPAGSKLKRCTKCYKVGYCDQTCQKQNWHVHKTQCKLTPDPVGTPFIISVPESRATFARLCQLMEAYARYSVDVFQPPVKVELPSKLSSQPSSSSLSNSSQSSGSLNSLDSQSSFSSSCTITAEQEENIEDMDIPPEVKVNDDGNIATSKPGNDVVNDGNEQFVGADSYVVKPESEGKSVSESDMVSVDSGYRTVIDGRNSCGSGDNTQSLDGAQEKEFVSPVKPVIGIQSGDAERTTPMFYLKPVNSEGTGLLGPDGERLDDNGDIPLDLTCKPYLSVDWKNNDKLPGYVLVQSKEMEFDNDSSMMTATLEESNNVTLQQCLELFTEPEVLAPEEAWYCPQCKEHREATKQLSSWKLPHTLIIQLKRFSFRNFIWRDKIDKMVEFPTRGLDLSHYYVGNRPTNEPPPVYDLYGVINHHGGILGGHYTSFVRCVDTDNSLKNDVGWRLCDDSRVSSISHEKNVVTRAAYLLFYRRRETFTPPPIECSLEIMETVERNKADDNEQETASREELHGIDEDGSNKTEFEMLGTGNLVIDTSDKASESADFDSSHDEGEDPSEIGGVPYIMLEDDAELGYTDMDSVD